MITLVVFLIVFILLVYLANSLLSSGLTFFINICIILLAAARASTDIKRDKMFGYYLASSLATVIVFIAEDTKIVKPVFIFFSKAYVLELSVALVLILFFAHLLKVGNIYSRKLVKESKKKIAEIKAR